jgi:hypothetical protein
VDALFEGSGWLYCGLALLMALIPAARHRAFAGAGLGLALLGAAGDRVGGHAAGTTFTTINEVLLLLGGGGVVAAALMEFRRRAASRPELALPLSRSPLSASRSPLSASRYPDPVLLTGLALAAAAPHLLLLELGILLALVSVVRAGLRDGANRWRLAVPLLGAILTGVALALMLTILGPEGGSIAALPDGPFSPPAERLLVMLLGLGSLLLAGIPPFQRTPPGLTLAPLAAILMARLLVPVLPGGLFEWQPLAMLLLLVSGGLAAFRGRGAAFAVVAGLAGLWSGEPSAAFAALVLVLFGWLIEQASSGRLGPIRRVPEGWAGLPLVIPALAALPVLAGGLQSQVVLSVALVLSGIVALLFRAARPPEGMQPPLY